MAVIEVHEQGFVEEAQETVEPPVESEGEVNHEEPCESNVKKVLCEVRNFYLKSGLLYNCAVMSYRSKGMMRKTARVFNQMELVKVLRWVVLDSHV